MGHVSVGASLNHVILLRPASAARDLDLTLRRIVALFVLVCPCLVFVKDARVGKDVTSLAQGIDD